VCAGNFDWAAEHYLDVSTRSQSLRYPPSCLVSLSFVEEAIGVLSKTGRAQVIAVSDGEGVDFLLVRLGMGDSLERRTFHVCVCICFVFSVSVVFDC